MPPPRGGSTPCSGGRGRRAGEAEERTEGARLREEQPDKDSTAVAVVEVTRTEVGLPRFLVMGRYLWTGTPHHTLYGPTAHLAELWAAASPHAVPHVTET